MGLIALGQRLVHDRWSPASHKPDLLEGRGVAAGLAPTWIVDESTRRRLRFYGLIRSYQDNNAHEYLAKATEVEKSNRREYGDPDLLVERIVGGLLGDSMEIVIDEANVDLPDSPVLPPEPDDPEPDDPGAEGSDIDRLLFTARKSVWERQAREAITAWTDAHAALPAARERQEWLRDWATDELFDAKVYEAERDGAVPLGDTVIVLALDRVIGRPVIQVYDPGWYFPVLGVNDRGYPTRVHLAWEFEEPDPNGGVRRFVERLTWELVDAPGASYPWSTTPSDKVCQFTDAYWRLDDLAERKLDDFTRAHATYRTNSEGLEFDALPLGIDFIPVVHIPGTPSTKEHFGRSMLARVLQIFDDLADADTDLHTAGKFAAGPMIAANRAIGSDGQVAVEPGTILNVGEGGHVDVIDLAGSLAPLQGMIEFLLDRLSVNSQVSAEILGRVGAADVPSGVALALSFGPFEQLVGVLRMVRESKYALVLKFVQRLAQAGGYLERGPTFDARLAFGSFLPTDTASVVDLAVRLLQVHGISKRTVLAWIQDAGLPITGDLAEELARIEGEDYAGAVELADATGDVEAVRAKLGLGGDGPELPEAPPGTPPGVPAGATADNAPPVISLPPA